MPKRSDGHTLGLWLGAGAITVGVGAALAGGTAVANADDTGPATTHSAATNAGPKRTVASTSRTVRPAGAKVATARPARIAVAGSRRTAVAAATPAPTAAASPYLQQFIAADPTGTFFTPASADFDAWVSGDYRFGTPTSYQANLAYYGTTGFSRDTSGGLRYTNDNPFAVAVLHAQNLSDPIAGIVVAQPGQTVTVPGKYAIAQAPRVYAPAGRPMAFLAVAGPGYPAGGTSGTGDIGQILASAGQRFAEAVDRFFRGAIPALNPVTIFNSTIQGLQILADVGGRIIDAVGHGVQQIFGRIF